VKLAVLRIAQAGSFTKTIKDPRHTGKKIPFPLITRIAFQARFELGFNLLGALFGKWHSKSLRWDDLFLKATKSIAIK